MKKYTRCFAVCMLLLAVVFGHTVQAQTGVLDPTDPIVNYKSSTPPTTPPIGQLAKWVRTQRMSWSTTSFKAYYYKGVAFRLKFPKTYQHGVADGKRYPIFVFFHGVGEKGSVYDNEYQLLHGGQTHMNAVDNGKFDGFLLYIQSSTSSGSFGVSYFEAVRELIENYFVPQIKVDPFRVLVGGLSGGGGATWQFLINYPKLVAGAAPISAASLSYRDAAQSLKYTPIWHFQGGLDNNPTPGTSEAVKTAFLNAGGNYKLTVYPKVGHSCWTNAWAEANYFNFLATANKANPWPLTGKAEFCPGEPIQATLGVTAGFDQYEWRKNGVLIPGATGNEYVATELGTYDCRIRRGTIWSDWSPIPVVLKMKGATVPPPITVSGMMSKVIPAPDNSEGVLLSVPDGYTSYSWQKDGNPAVLGTTNELMATTPGNYVVKVSEQFGCASEFSAPFTVIDANGPNKPDPAINIIVSTLSKTELRLDWSDNPAPQYNETAFEVYQAEQAGGPYTLVKIVPADVLNTSINDLNANTTYYFRIRAVNESGAAPLSAEASGKTAADTQAPTAPAGLTVTGVSGSSVSLSWQPSQDDVEVTRYDVYINGKKSFVTSETDFTIYNLERKKTYTFQVAARDFANNVSPFSNQVTAQPRHNGLVYKYYKLSSALTALPDFKTMVPDEVGTIASVSTSPKKQNNNYAFLWEGYIFISTSGTYTFRTNSDDGSRLWIGAANGSGSPYVHGTSLVDNDGSHTARNRDASIYLTAGVYPFAAAYFQNTSSSAMTVSWKVPGSSSFVTIPSSAFAENETPEGTAPAAPSKLVATAESYNKITLSWVDNSNNETGFEIWRSTNPDNGYETVGTAPANATSYADSALTPATRYFYRIRAIGAYGESAFASTRIEALWRFNNNYTDEGPNARGLTANGNPSFDASSKQEGSHSLKLNGSSQYVTISATGNFLKTAFSERTVALWIKSNNNTSNRVIFDLGGNDNGLALVLNNNTLIAAIASGSSRTTISTSYTSTAWNHVAVVYKENTLRLYLNGVQVASKTNLSYTSIKATSNASRIGYNNGNNAYNNNGTYFNGWIDNFGIYATALDQAEVAALMNNTFASSDAKTLPLPGIPAAPTQAVATATSTSSIKVTWNDNASNEEKIELYRSANTNGNYVLLATLPANSTSYDDTGLFANARYYYKVRTVNVAGPSALSNETNATTQNNIPVLNASYGNQYMRYGSVLELPVSATDADQGTLNVSVTNLPSFGSYISNGNGSGVIRFEPGIGDQQQYNNITVTVTDANGGSDSFSFNLEVNDNYNPQISPVQDVNLAEKETAAATLTAVDQNAGDVLTWSFTGLPDFATVSGTAGNSVTLNFTPGYADGGTYRVGVAVSDGRNGIDTTSFMLNVAEVNPNKRILVNFNSGITSAPAPWNNTNKPPVLNDVFGPFSDENGAATSVGIRIMSSWQAMNNGTNELGAKTNNNTGVYPDAVISTAYWSSTAQQTFKVTGLDVNAKYNFTFFGSRSGVTDDRTTAYTVNGVVVTLNAASNTMNTVTAHNIVPDADGSVTISIKNVSPSVYSYLNAMVIDQLYDDQTAPAPVRDLTAHLTGNQASLTWIDAAYNEDGYGVYRASSAAGPFTLRGTVDKNSGAFADGAVSGNSTYYYFVRGANGYGTTDSDTIELVTPNVAPIIDPVANVTLKNNEVRHINIQASDDAGDVISFSASGLPSFVSLTDNGNGTAVLHVTPGSTTVGIFEGITIKATDDKGAESTLELTVSVADKDITSIYVNFNQFSPVGSPWNSFNALPLAGTSIANLKDLLNTPTGATITLVDKWTGANEVGAVTGDDSGVYPDEVMKSSFYESSTASKTVRLSGLNPAMKYNLNFFGSRIASDDRTTIFAAGGKTVSLNAAGNTKNTVSINGLVPNASGIIEFTVTKGANSSYAYLNALVIQSYIDNGLPLAPSSLVATAKSKTSISLSWSDKSDNETGFEIYRAASPNGNYTLRATVGANVTSYEDAGLAVNTSYYYKVRSKLGSAASSFSNVAGATTFSYQMFINFNRENPAGAPWYNTNAAPQEGMIFDNIHNEQGNPSGLTMTVTKNFSGDNPFGMLTGDDSGVFPDDVIRSTWWVDAGSYAKLKLSGLSQAMQYSFVFFGSRNGMGDKTTVYTINGKSASLQCAYNVNNTAQIDNIIADENGEVEITISLGATSEYGYIGAMVVRAANIPDSVVVNDNPVMNSVSELPGSATGPVAMATLIVDAADATEAAVESKAEVWVVEKLPVVTELNTYPNPFREVIQVDLNLPKAQERLTIRILDISGRIMMTQEYRNLPAGRWTQRLAVGNRITQSGIYIMQVIGDDNKLVPVTRKLIRGK